MRLILDVPDDQGPSLLSEMEQRGFTVQVEDIPTWHKEGIDRIRSTTPPDAYTPLDDFLKEWEAE